MVGNSRRVSSQQAYPWRAVLRTFVQGLAAAGVVVSVVAAAVAPGLEGLVPDQVIGWVGVAGVAGAGVAAGVARVMSVPGVDSRLGVLSSTPARKEEERQGGE